MPEDLKEQIEVLTKKIADGEAALSNVVGELKDDREKRKALTDENETLKKALEEATKASLTTSVPDDIAKVVETLVEQKLSQKDASSAQSNKVAAVEKFVAENKAFHPENDVTGKLREALENKLKQFNTQSLHTSEEFYTVIRDAASLLGVNTTPQTSSEVPNPYSSTPRFSITPAAAEDKDINPLEKRLIERNGMSKESFLALKAKNPAYINNLLNLMQK